MTTENIKSLAETLQAGSVARDRIEMVKINLMADMVLRLTEISTILKQAHGIPATLPANKVQAEPAPVVEEVAVPVEKKPAAKKKAPAAPAQPELPLETPAVDSAPTVVAPKAVSKEALMPKLVAFIQANGEAALSEVFADLGGKSFKQFPEIPAELYGELLEKIGG